MRLVNSGTDRSGLFFCVCLALVLTVPTVAQDEKPARNKTPGQTIPSTHAKPAEQVYRNIRVLKGIPADEIIPAMQFVAASLGVECGFCHVENHFEQDDKKPKQTARTMMQMEMAINASSFKSQLKVTCNTCHRGSRVPVSIPGISDAPLLSQPETEAVRQNLPSADQLLSSYVQALGGADAISKTQTLKETGVTEFNGHEFPVEVLSKAPAEHVLITHLPDGDAMTGFDGNHGWILAPHRPVRPLPSSELEGARMDADPQFPLHIKAVFGELRPAPAETINGRVLNQLVAETDGQLRARFYFDPQTGMLVRVVRYARSPLGLNPTRIDFADYRSVDGVQIPFCWEVSRPLGRFRVELKDVKQNVAIDDSVFSAPPQQRPAASPANIQ